MNNITLTITMFLLLFFASCDTKKIVETPQNPPKVEKKPPVEITSNQPLEPVLEGRWTITRISAFSDQLPTYEPGDVIYEFSGPDRMLKVTRKQDLSERTPSLPTGEYNYGADECLMFIGDRMFFYNIKSNKSKISGERIALTLDTNIDPSISSDGSVFILTKIP